MLGAADDRLMQVRKARAAVAAAAAELLREVRLVVLDAQAPPPVERQPRLHHVVDHIDLLLASDVHCYQVETGAGHAREGDVDVDAYPLAACCVHVEVVSRDRREVSAQLRNHEQENDAARHDGDRGTGAGALLEVVERLRVHVQPLERLHHSAARRRRRL